MMKRMIVVCAWVFLFFAASGQVEGRRFRYGMTFGTGIPVNTPSHVPFTWQLFGLYELCPRFFAGVGTGLSVHEKPLLPLFADLKYVFMKSRRFTPYAECGVGYSFAPGKGVRGGFYVSPSIGVQYPLCSETRLLFSVGYEWQKLERLKSYRDAFFRTEFQESLRHGTVCFRVGVLF